MQTNQLTGTRLLFAALLVLIACAVLGAFSACDLNLVLLARGGADQSARLIPIGIGAGLTAGLLVFLWDRRWAQQGFTIRRRFAIRIAYASVWLVFAALSRCADWSHARNWRPVYVPIRFDTVNSITASFAADQDAKYDVLLDLKRNLPFEDINAFTGSWQDQDKPPHKSPPRPEVAWTVDNVAEGDKTTCWSGESWGETIGLGIGDFKAIKGRRYTITCRITKPSQQVQILDPHLLVEPGVGYSENFVVLGIMAMIAGIFAAFVGIALVTRAVIKLKADQRNALRLAEINEYPK